jgi:hypothetical protein
MSGECSTAGPKRLNMPCEIAKQCGLVSSRSRRLAFFGLPEKRITDNGTFSSGVLPGDLLADIQRMKNVHLDAIMWALAAHEWGI